MVTVGGKALRVRRFGLGRDWLMAWRGVEWDESAVAGGVSWSDSGASLSG